MRLPFGSRLLEGMDAAISLRWFLALLKCFGKSFWTAERHAGGRRRLDASG